MLPPAEEEESSSEEDIDDSEDSDEDEQEDVDSMATTKKMLKKAQGSPPAADQWVDYGYNYTKELPLYMVAGEGLEMIEVGAKPAGPLGVVAAAPTGDSGPGDPGADDGAKPAPLGGGSSFRSAGADAQRAMNGDTFESASKDSSKYGLDKLMVGTAFEIDDEFEFHNPGVYHDLGCSCAFAAVAVGMVAIALMGVVDSFNLDPEVVAASTICTQRCQNGGVCSEVADYCDCPTGCFGDYCETCISFTPTSNTTNTTFGPEPEPEPEPSAWRSEQLAMLLVALGIALSAGVLTALLITLAIWRFPDHVVWLPLGAFVLIQLR